MKLLNRLGLLIVIFISLSYQSFGQCTVNFNWTVNPQTNAISFNATTFGLDTTSTVYSWDFGDGSTGFGVNPTHSYNGLGYYTVCLTASDSNCTVVYCDSVSALGTNPCANFASYFTHSINGNSVTFSSTVNGGTAPFNYQWQFGDGGYSSLANPSYTYNSAGVYSVILVVTDANGCIYTAWDSIIVGSSSPCLGATGGYQYAVGTNGLTTFYPYTSGFSNTFLNYSWTVNGTISGTSTGANWQSTLINGWNIVCVTITDSICTYTYCDSIFVQGQGSPCAGFSASYSYTVNANTVDFTSTIIAGTAPFNYQWQFGDGGYSALSNPSHTYNGPGMYGALLVVTDANGCAYTVYDTVIVNTPCNQNIVNLTINLDNYAYETSWDLRDVQGFVIASGSGYTTNQNGTTITSSLCLPTDCYTFNIYDSYGDGICCLYGQGHYSLTDVNGNVLASGGAFGYTETQTICVGGATNPCTGMTTSFTSTTNGNVVSFNTNATGLQYVWDFGDNSFGSGSNPVHTYANAPASGYYIVCLTAYDTIGCVATYCDTVVVNPLPCNNNMATLTLYFDNFAYETSWSITDQNSNVIYSGSSYTQGDNGTTLHLNFCLPTGCYDFNIFDSYGDGICCAWGQGYYALTSASGTTLASGGAFGYSEHTNFCVGGATNPCGNFNASWGWNASSNGQVYFNSQVFGGTGPYTYAWDFGNNNLASGSNTTFTYSNNGFYSVCLTVTDANGCTAVYCDSIMVNNAPNNNSTPCNGLSVDMNIFQDSLNPFLLYMQPVVNNALPNTNYYFVWDFGDNTGAFGGYPVHQYNNWGSYIVCITALDSMNGCIASFCDTITIDSAGNFSRNINYKDVKPGFMVNTLQAEININTSLTSLGTEKISFGLYPNPTSSVINLNVNTQEFANAKVSILDVTGKSVLETSMNIQPGMTQTILDVHSISSGVYFINLMSEGFNKTIRFIRE
ncbi:MAG: PKD domain-containing protein [Saprospiraceae bacterium]|nr:PKD domain-containing protein [Saprospiraceae bacterium]